MRFMRADEWNLMFGELAANAEYIEGVEYPFNANIETAEGDWILQTDGCCFGNPGIAGAGIVIYRNMQEGIVEQTAFGYQIGNTGTNNIAEMVAFIIGAEKTINLAE